MTDNTDRVDYSHLNPDCVIQAVESQGYLSDARVLALNSYENRVYQIGLEEQQPIIAKFYRPGRWTDEQILEEHEFSTALFELEIPAVPPIYKNHSSSTSNSTTAQSLFSFNGYRFSLYPRRGGRAPELTDPNHLYWLGKFLGRIHAVGKIQPFKFRPLLSIASYILEPSSYLLENQHIPAPYNQSYEAIVNDIISHVENHFSQVQTNTIRLHGDCHPGNILWTDAGPHFVDFDDSRNGPAIQDLWMLLSGERAEQQKQLNEILEGYEEFCEFNYAEIQLIESLRSMRIIHYAAWLAKRWDDPAFPKAFPWFNTEAFWGEHILQLKEQLAALQEPPLQLFP